MSEELIKRLSDRVEEIILENALNEDDAGTLEAVLSRLERLTARVKELEGALRPFVDGAAHTQVFLRSREKMHPVGQDLYAEDVERARTTLRADQ